MRNWAAGLCLSAVLAARMVDATPAALTAAQLHYICESETILEAEARGGQLGWLRTPDAQLEEWRRGFVAFNGGTVQVLGWRRDGSGRDSLSFWVAQGPSRHRACYYATANPEGLLDALSERFGTPATLERQDAMTTASWVIGRTEVSFARVGSSAVVNIARHG
jgi:hypothetical protein